eukprot:c14352_g1_i1 orf=2-175(-)
MCQVRPLTPVFSLLALRTWIFFMPSKDFKQILYAIDIEFEVQWLEFGFAVTSLSLSHT